MHVHNNNPNNKAVFTINGTAYTEKTVNGLIAFPLSRHLSNRDSLSRQAFSYLKREQAARQLNIEPTSYEIKQTELVNFGPKLSNQLNNMSWIKLVSYDEALQKNLNTNNLSQYQGYSFIFWFGQHLETGPAYTVPDFGDQKLIAQDRAYASGRANYYYNQLKSKKMTADAVLKAVKNDPKLGYALPNSRFINYSAHFGLDSSKSWQDQAIYPDIINYVAAQSQPGLSTVRTGKIGIVPVPKAAKDYADGYFYVVQLNTAKKAPSITASGFSTIVNGVKAKYNGW